MKTFNNARAAWNAAAQFRATRLRLKNYSYGRQWDDIVKDPHGCAVTEKDAAERQGLEPVTTNLLRSAIKCVVGRFRHQLAKSRAPETPGMRTFRIQNALDELDARTLEEFLISGCAIQRVMPEVRPQGPGIWADIVNPANFFVNHYQDPRGCDIRLVGRLCEMPLDEVVMRFAPRDPARAETVTKIYDSLPAPLVGVPVEGSSFVSPSARDLCRVVEVWTFDYLPDPHWHCRYYAPDGSQLASMRSPLPSGSHPFAIKMYPLIDGEVHSFIEDIIDRQRHINRLLTTMASILAHSSKGALLMSSDALMNGISFEEIKEIYAHPGAVIPINPNATLLPREINTTGRCDDAAKLLEIEMGLFQQTSGVSAAMTGFVESPAMSASLFDARVANSAIALEDIFETFNAFRRHRDALAENLLLNIY